MHIFDWLYIWLTNFVFRIQNPIGVHPADGPQDLARCASDIILEMNGGPAYTNGVVYNPAKGTLIHKVSKQTADTLAETMIAASKETSLPLAYGMACLCAESLFDPACQNGNLLGSNKANDPAGYDMGIAQLKLRYLIGNSGITDVNSAQTFAMDPTKAIPYCFRSMNSRLLTADEFIKQTNPDTQEFVGFHNRYYVATAEYNFGKTGFDEMNHNEPVSHSDIVMKYERQFSTLLGEPSVFGDVK